MARTQVTIGEKLRILGDLATRTAQGESLRSVVQSYDVQPSQLRRWKQKEAVF